MLTQLQIASVSEHMARGENAFNFIKDAHEDRGLHGDILQLENAAHLLRLRGKVTNHVAWLSVATAIASRMEYSDMNMLGMFSYSLARAWLARND